MATIRTFKAVRPDAPFAQDVAALPYDVMNEAEARAMTKDKPHSVLHVDRSEVDMPEGTDPHHASVYLKAADTLNRMIADGVFVTEDTACLYIYQLVRNGVPQTGLVACTAVDEYIDGTIKKHEYTVAAKEEDRINHVDYCDANTGPIFLAYKSQAAAQKIIDDYMASNKAVYDFVAEDDVTHRVWVISDQTICEDLVKQFATIPNFYIADGHHRNASACAVALKRRKDNPAYTGEEEFNFYLSVLFPSNQLHILDYNRVVADLAGNDKEQFLKKNGRNIYCYTLQW